MPPRAESDPQACAEVLERSPRTWRQFVPAPRPWQPVHLGGFPEGDLLSGIKDSPTYVREPQCNGIAERIVRILKQNLLLVLRFNAVEDLRQVLLAFNDTYSGSGASADTAIAHRPRRGNTETGGRKVVLI